MMMMLCIRKTRLQPPVYIECTLMTFDLYSSICRCSVRAGTSSLFPSLLIDQTLKPIDTASDELRFALSSLSRVLPLVLQGFLFYISHH